MDKQVIPINMIEERRMHLFSVNENKSSFNPQSLYANAFNGLKSCKYAPIKTMLVECSKGYFAPRTYWELCYNTISEMRDWQGKEKEVLEVQNIFLENILPKITDLRTVRAYTHSHCLSKSFVEKIDEICDILTECERVIHNNDKLSTRFNFTQIIRENDEVSSAEDTIETLCELVDTYNIPVHAKLNAALENILYSYDRMGVDIDKADAIQHITEYFLRHNNEISDKDYAKICNVLENNKFISAEDINKLYYLFSENAQVKDPTGKKYKQITNEGRINYDVALESKDFADSNDVKDIIKKYKADQKKDEGRFKIAISHIYTKKPEKIIDDTPNILEFIRNFGILGTLAINPILTIVVFCADKYIELGMKRKEAERVLKYFKAEKVKVENKINKANDGDRKDRLEEYSKCLDKSIEKLEYYRDNLYTDTQLDELKELEEASNVKFFDKLSIEQYFEGSHPRVCNNVMRAIQLFYNEFLRKYAKPYVEIEEYELFDDEKISTTLADIDEELLIKYFVTPDGMINIPLFRIKFINPGEVDTPYLFEDITNSCSFINDFLSSDCIITNYLENDNIYILFNFLKCLYVENNDAIDYSLTFEARQEIANLLALAESVDEMEKIYPVNLIKDLSKNIETIACDDIDGVAHLISNSNCIDISAFTDIFKDYQSSIADPIVSTNIMEALEYMKNAKNNYTIIESCIVQAESIKLLNAIVQEAKTGNKKPVTTIKNNIAGGLDAVKDQVSKGSKQKTSITTNLGLATEMLKKKAQNLSTKEQEISRNVDISLSAFKKSVEKSLTTNRREAIIQGSIIPSFSKMIKAGMVAGGLFLVNPVVAAIGVIGALAVSKSLTERERQMLLDEIDIELKAVDKEISMAESNNRMKEYRHLLTYQRKLQREKQRIKYRLKVYGKDNIPDVKGEE